MELKKLQGLIQESTDQFDEVLKALFLRKIKTQMVIYQVRLVTSQWPIMSHDGTFCHANIFTLLIKM